MCLELFAIAQGQRLSRVLILWLLSHLTMKLEVCVHVPGLSPRLLYLCAFRSTSAYRRSKNGRIALTNDVRVSATSVICRDACLSPMGTVPQSSLQPPEQLRRVYNLSVIIHVLYCVSIQTRVVRYQ